MAQITEKMATDTADESADENQASLSVLLAALEALTNHLADTAGKSGVGLNSQDIHKLGGEFSAKEGKLFCLELSAHIHESLLQHERELWDQTRRRPFERLLVARFSNLFPHEGELDSGSGFVSRRILPGFFMAIEMMAGQELFEKCHRACKNLAKTRKEEQGSSFLWRDFYVDKEANVLVDDTLAVIVPHFADFDKRFRWLRNLMNGHLAAPDDFAFEGDIIAQWQMDDKTLLRMLQSLFSVFYQRLSEDGGREKVVQRYGEKFCADLQTVLGHLGLEA